VSFFSHTSRPEKYIATFVFFCRARVTSQQERTTMSAVEQRIRVLRERFAEALPGRVAELRKTWIRLNANPAAANLQQDLARQLHTLGGTAGTYGLTRVAGLAVEGEITCADVGIDPDAETLPYLATIIDDIGQAVDAWLSGEYQ
jgi:chemotaxis protein histidine kinase CheA